MTFIKKLFAGVISFFKGIGAYAKGHKVIAGIGILVLLGLGYWGYSSYQTSVTTTQYVLAFAHTAPIESTISGSGQVASEHQLNLSPKASGTITSVRVRSGATVRAGQVIATIDNTTASKALRDAAANLASARISYQQTLTSNTNTVGKTHDAVFTAGSTAYSDMATVLNGIRTIMQGNEVSGSYAIPNVRAYSKLFNDNPSITQYRDRLVTDYASAEQAYATASSDYASANRSADNATTARLAAETYTTAQAVTQTAKDLSDYLNAVNMRYPFADTSKPTILASHLSSAQSYLNTMNSDQGAVSTAQNDFASAVASSNASGATTLSQESAQINLQKAQNAYQDAKDTLADYVVVAPFPGTIANVALQVYDQAGSGTTVAILVTKQQYATLSLNEVDAANVKVGQPATLTFDALSGLTLNGTVASVDTVGTVSSGVVSYTVKIGFDSQDPRILPGMTVNASVITASNPTALVVPSSAVKTQGTQSYVEVATYNNGVAPGFGAGSSTRPTGLGRNASSTTASGTPRTFGGNAPTTGAVRTGPTVDAANVTLKRVNVTTGIISDTMTEITSGLTPGEFVVSSSLNASGKSTASSPSIFNLFGGGARPSTTGAPRTGGATGAVRTSGNATFVGRNGG